MKLTVNHPDKEIREFIMNYLYDFEDIKGDEEHLKDEKLSDFMFTKLYELEDELSKHFEENIDLPKDLKLIEVK